MKKPVTITITGAAGNIGYALAFRVASGQMLGPDQPVNLNLLEIPAASAAVQGVVMELNDCAFATLNKTTATSDPNVGFKDCDFAMLVGARPRGPGMERKDLLLENAKIFSAQGKALDAAASRDVRVLVVGNPANTNSLIAQRNAPSLPRSRFTAMTRLDHNRGLAQLQEKTGAPLAAVKKVIIWGNHSATQYPDLHHATVEGKAALSLVDHAWFKDSFIPTVQQRGAAIIKAREHIIGSLRGRGRARSRARLDARDGFEAIGSAWRCLPTAATEYPRASFTHTRSPARTASTASYRDWRSMISAAIECRRRTASCWKSATA